MPILWRRSSIISFGVAFRRSRPSNRISPPVGSMSRERQRTSVDFPEPLRPMMTRISPGNTSRVASLTAGM